MKFSKMPFVKTLMFLFILLFIHIVGFSQGDIEPNNTFETANAMFPGTLQSGSVNYTDNVDYFGTNSFINGTIYVHVIASNTDQNSNKIIIKCSDQRNYAFTQLYISMAPGQKIDSIFKIDGLAISAFYISISCYDSLSYSFSYEVTNIPSFNDVEPNDNISKATYFNSIQPIEGQIGYKYNSDPFGRDKYDYYKIVSPIVGTLNINLIIKSNENAISEPQLYVFDSKYGLSDEIVIEGLSYLNTTNKSLSIACEANDTFYIYIDANIKTGIGVETAACTYQINCGFSSLPVKVNVLNPNPNLINSNGTISVNTSQIDTTQTVTAAATDGITKLLLVTNGSFPLTFSVADNDGSLSSLSDQRTLAKQITIQPDNNGKVVAVYTVPDGYGITNPIDGRNAIITIADAGNAESYTTTSIKLVTPPVVMVHGMWSDPSIWDRGGFTTTLAGSGIRNIYLADYSQVSSATFDPNSFESFIPRMSVQVQIDKALNDYHDKKIAVTQVDIVGHSLGGLMTRSLSQQSSFLEQRNYYKGFVHKLITMGTPHRGSPLGPELYKFKDSLTYYHIDGVPVSAPYPLSFILQLAGMPIGSCHKDFGITSQGIADLSTTLPYRTFAITADHQGNGIIPGDLIGYLGMEGLCEIAFHKPFEDIMESRCNTGVLPNDLIVPYKSQTGYINSTQLFYGTCHSIPGLLTETNNPLIQAKVTELLLSDDTTEFSVGFPAPLSFPLESCDNTTEVIGKNQPKNKNEVSNSLAGNTQPTGKEYVQISAPSRGSIYHQNIDTVITVAYQPLGGSIPTNALLIIKDVGWYKLPITAPYSTTIILPKNVKTGNLNMVLMVSDTTGINLVDTSHITFLPSGILNNISIQPTSLHFDSTNRQTKIIIQEEYAGVYGTYFSDISDTADGINYTTQKGDSIITVAADGIVTAVSAGTDTLIVQVSNSTFRVPVIVDSNFLSRTLYPNIIDFADIPNKTINASPFALDATATSGDKVNFTVINGPAEIINGLVYIQGTGMVTIQATCSGNVYFDSAVPVIKSFYANGVLAAKASPLAGMLNQNHTVSLSWKTYTETNNKGFNIERNTGNGWQTIGFVKGTNNSTSTQQYSFIDSTVVNGKIYYYRYKQEDNDGHSTYSNEIAIEIVGNHLLYMTVAPNPFKDQTTITYNLPVSGHVLLRLFDYQGRAVSIIVNAEEQAGAETKIFNQTSNLASGVYVLRLETQAGVITNKIVIVE